MIDPAPWIFSPHPDLEKKIVETRVRYPMLKPAGPQRVEDLLERLGNPQKHLPPVFHVAGTNGKGSVLAFLQAIFENGGKSVHKFTGPHLVEFSERIVLNGHPIEPEDLIPLIDEVSAKAPAGSISFLEFFTALAFLAFSRRAADAVLLETGMGGRDDMTNVLEENACAMITRISYDHVTALGGNLTSITLHKAGIMRKGCPVVLSHQKDPKIQELLCMKASEAGATLYTGWSAQPAENGFTYQDKTRDFHLPAPALIGAHQIENAGVAIAAISAALPENPSFRTLLQSDILSDAMRRVKWPARLQHLQEGALVRLLPENWELWVDGAHNDSGAEALSQQLKRWSEEETNKKPACLILAMKKKKNMAAILGPLLPHTQHLCLLRMPDQSMENPDFIAQSLAQSLIQTTAKRKKTIYVAENLESAIQSCAFSSTTAGRIIMTGSLSLAGMTLRQNAN